MSVFTRNAIQGKTQSSGMNTNQSGGLTCANPQPQYPHQKRAADTRPDPLQTWDETEALILSCSEESDLEMFLEEITETPADDDDLFDWELFVNNYLSTESASDLSNDSQNLSLTPQFSSTKMEDYDNDQERLGLPEEISDLLGDWMDWCYHMERRSDHRNNFESQTQLAIKAHGSIKTKAH